MNWKQRLLNQRGDFNIVIAALTLPVLILLVTVAFEVLRIPIMRQHVYSILHAAAQSMTHPSLPMDTNAYVYEPTTGVTWCLFQSSTHPSYACPEDGLALDGEVRFDGASDLKYVVTSIASQLESAFSVLKVSSANYEVVGGVYGIDSTSDGELVDVYDIIGSSSVGNLDYPLDPHADLKNSLLASPSPMPTHFLLPEALGTQRAITAVIVISAAVRISHIFMLPETLTFGATPVEGGDQKQDETTLTVTLIRPLPRNMRLSGPASNVPPTP